MGRGAGVLPVGLAPAGQAFLEIGFGQAAAVAGLAADAGFITTFAHDLASLRKVVDTRLAAAA